MVALPALMAGLPVSRAMVKVAPPLSCRGPRRGSAMIQPVPISELKEEILLLPVIVVVPKLKYSAPV